MRPDWWSGRRPQGRDQGIGKESMFKFIEDCPRDEPEEKMIPFLVAEETEAQSWVWPQICSVCVWYTQSAPSAFWLPLLYQRSVLFRTVAQGWNKPPGDR